MDIDLFVGKVQTLGVEQLIPYEFNNKDHPERQIDLIANSIKEYGFTQPVVCDKDKVIIIGHGRVLAAKKLGMKEVPTIIRDDLTEVQVKKLRLLDNKLSDLGTYNLENIQMEISEIDSPEIRELFPEFEAPEYDPDAYEEGFGVDNAEQEQNTLVITFNTEAEAMQFKDEVRELLESYDGADCSFTHR